MKKIKKQNISEFEIKEKLNKLANDLKDKRNSDWTIEIKKIFSEYFNNLFANENYFTAANGLNILGSEASKYIDYENEFLYDLIIFQEKKENVISSKIGKDVPFITKTLLALECDWGDTKSVIDDFQKLLLSNAEYKIIIFDGNRVCDVDSVLKYMSENIKNYSNSNGVFLLICYINFEKKFKIKIL